MNKPKYKHWDLLDSLPPGWVFDKTAGSPLHGYEFAHNGKSVLKGQLRALVRVYSEPAAEPKATPAPIKQPQKPDVTPATPRDINELARKRFMLRLLADIRTDLIICDVEGWNKREYIEEIKALIDSISPAKD